MLVPVAGGSRNKGLYAQGSHLGAKTGSGEGTEVLLGFLRASAGGRKFSLSFPSSWSGIKSGWRDVISYLSGSGLDRACIGQICCDPGIDQGS